MKNYMKLLAFELKLLRYSYLYPEGVIRPQAGVKPLIYLHISQQ